MKVVSHKFPFSVINNLKFERFNFNDDYVHDHVITIPECNYNFCDSDSSGELLKLSSNTLKLLAYNIII